MLSVDSKAPENMAGKKAKSGIIGMVKIVAQPSSFRAAGTPCYNRRMYGYSHLSIHHDRIDWYSLTQSESRPHMPIQLCHFLRRDFSLDEGEVK